MRHRKNDTNCEDCTQKKEACLKKEEKDTVVIFKERGRGCLQVNCKSVFNQKLKQNQTVSIPFSLSLFSNLTILSLGFWFEQTPGRVHFTIVKLKAQRHKKMVQNKNKKRRKKLFFLVLFFSLCFDLDTISRNVVGLWDLKQKREKRQRLRSLTGVERDAVEKVKQYQNEETDNEEGKRVRRVHRVDSDR